MWKIIRNCFIHKICIKTHTHSISVSFNTYFIINRCNPLAVNRKLKYFQNVWGNLVSQHVKYKPWKWIKHDFFVLLIFETVVGFLCFWRGNNFSSTILINSIFFTIPQIENVYEAANFIFVLKKDSEANCEKHSCASRKIHLNIY